MLMMLIGAKLKARITAARKTGKIDTEGLNKDLRSILEADKKGEIPPERRLAMIHPLLHGTVVRRQK